MALQGWVGFCCSQRDSAWCIHVSPPSWSTHPSVSAPRSSQSPELGSLSFEAASHWPSVWHAVMYRRHGHSLSSSLRLSSSRPLLPPPRPQLCENPSAPPVSIRADSRTHVLFFAWPCVTPCCAWRSETTRLQRQNGASRPGWRESPRRTARAERGPEGAWHPRGRVLHAFPEGTMMTPVSGEQLDVSTESFTDLLALVHDTGEKNADGADLSRSSTGSLSSRIRVA